MLFLRRGIIINFEINSVRTPKTTNQKIIRSVLLSFRNTKRPIKKATKLVTQL